MLPGEIGRLAIVNFGSKIVVVTGGSSGIGQQLAIDLSRCGARVVICSNDSGALKRAHVDLIRMGLEVDAHLCDVRSTDQVRNLADHVLLDYGQIDILINNAGYAVYRPFEESAVEEITDLLDVNLSGAMRCAKAFLPYMLERRSGHIVNISSIGGETIITPNAVYCAAKHGMVAWTKALRYELARFGVKVNAVCPGHTKTNFHNHPTFRRRDPYRKKNARSLTVKQVSVAVLDTIDKDRIVTYVPKRLGLVAWALNALPFLTLPVWDRISRQRITQLYEQIDIENQSHHDS